MRRCFIFSGLFFALLLFSCAGRKLQSHEWPLWHEAGSSDWWLINSVMKSEQGNEMHLTGLVMLESAEGVEYGHCFLSTWNEGDSSYTNYRMLGTLNLPGDQKKPRFPIVYSGNGQNDSLPWQLFINDRYIQIPVPGSDGNRLTAEGSFPRQKPIFFFPMSTESNVWILEPLHTRWNIQDKKSELTGDLSLRIFKDTPTDMLSRERQSALIWIDLDLPDGSHLCGLFSQKSDGKIHAVNVKMWDGAGVPQRAYKTLLTMEAGSEWQSEVSGKPYGLNYRMTVEEMGISVLIGPRYHDQEVRVSRNSFWMGAIDSWNIENGENGGKGNMYIFNLQ